MKKLLFLLFIISFLYGCIVFVKPPKFSIVGERTVIENQMIGEYEEFEEDDWIKASMEAPEMDKKNNKNINK